MYENLYKVNPNGDRPSEQGELIPHNGSNIKRSEAETNSDKAGHDDGLSEAKLEEIIFGED